MFRDPIPLLPEPDQARQWLDDELSHPNYAEAQPTWFDQASRSVAKFFEDLFNSSLSGAGGTVVTVVIGLLIVVLAVMAVLIWGNPRLRRQSANSDEPLFDLDDERSADELRSASEAAAARGDHDAAVVLRLRAVARALRERGAVTTGPGSTVQTFAEQASTAFPTHADALHTAAAAFDDVRYLRRPGSPEMFHSMRELDRTLAATRPAALASLDELA